MLNKEKIIDYFLGAFNKNICSINNRQIKSERDWQKFLYFDLKEYFLPYNDVKIYLEYPLEKSGNDTVWISPQKYGLKSNLVDNYLNPGIDDQGWVKVNTKKITKDVPSEVKRLLKDEGKRAFYVDILIKDFQTGFIWAAVELKYGSKLDESTIYDDIRKLQRIKEIQPDIPFIVAAGFNTSSENLFWHPLIEDCNFKVNQPKNEKKYYPKEITADSIQKKLVDSTIGIYLNGYYNEAMWNGEMIYCISKLLPKEWRVNAEIPVIGKWKGRIDLGIFDSNGCLRYAIELKGHYEAPFPQELKNDLYRDKQMQENFFSLTKKFIDDVDCGNISKSSKGCYPKCSSGNYVNDDFFDKIIELHDQYKRLLEFAEISGTLGYLLFIDHNDDFSLRELNFGFTESQFIDNFMFRKEIIEKVMDYNPDGNVKFIYFLKLNGKNYTYSCNLIQ